MAAAVEPAQLIGLIVGGRIGTKLVARDPGLLLRFLGVLSFIAAGPARGLRAEPVALAVGRVQRLVTAVFAAIVPGHLRRAGHGDPAPRPGDRVQHRVRSGSCPACSSSRSSVASGTAAACASAMLLMLPVFVVGGLIISSAGRVITRDITQVWTTAAARSEVAYERRQGRSKLLLVRDLDVSYSGVQVLFDVSLEVDEGEIIALLGTNGAGKSTLLRTISGIVEADRGAIIFDGVDMTATPPAEIAGRGVLQVPGGVGTFPSLTVRQNLEVASWLHRRDAKARPRRHRTRPGAVPGARDPPAGAGRQPVGRPAAAARPGHGLPLEAAAADDRRAVDRPGAGDRRAAPPAPARPARPGHHDHPRRAVGERRPHAWPRPPTSWRRARSASRAPPPSSSSAPTSSARCSSRGPAGPPARRRAPRRRPAPRRPATVGSSEEPVAVRRRRCRRVDLTRSFGGLRAVDDVSISVAPRRGRRDHRAQRRRQDHALRRDLRASPPRTAGGSCSPGTTSAGSRRTSRAERGLGRSFQDARLFPAMTVDEALAVSLERFVTIEGPGERGAAPARTPTTPSRRWPSASTSWWS